jgi:sugar phosphate isomerase/epimerase
VHVLVENHGGLSSDPASLLRVLESAGTPWVGTLPDFGNFPPGTDRYAAVRAMMPFAKAVSAKCYDFDEGGQETRIDFGRMLRIVLDAGYRGHVGIEYEGTRLGEHEGILAARELLLDLRRALGPEYS